MGAKTGEQPELDGVGDYIDDLAQAVSKLPWEHTKLFKEPPPAESGEDE